MNHAHFATSDWYRAATLSERMTTLAAEPGQREGNVAIAKPRLERWQQQSPFATGTYFAERLAVANITETQLLTLLGESSEAVKERCSTMPAWLVQIVQAFTQAATSPSSPSCMSALTHASDHDSFVSLVEPLMAQGCQRVLEGIQQLRQEHVELPFDPQRVITMLRANLTEQLHGILDRTLVLELQVQRLQGVLEGETSEARYHSFVERLRRPEVALALLQEYPVLARQTTICISYWVTFSLEFLQHLCADWQAIKATFSPDENPGLLVELQGGAGDRHRQGHSVLIAKFHSGFQLVYKPRSLAVDIHFQSLLAWLNARSERWAFRTLKVLNRTSYGWLEFVTAQSCTTQDEVQRFYERQGGYLALLYALQATDFHSENLIAVGEQPVLVDLEALFHPAVGEWDASKANFLASEKVANSVLGIGLLPQRVWGNDVAEGIDLSGLGAQKGQLTPYQLPYWEAAATDEMRLARKRMEILGRQNRPTLQGQEVNLLHYEEALVTGFTHIYQLLLHYRDELLAADGPIAVFAGDDVRVILRFTRLYVFLLAESFHPDLLRDALERDRHFDRLWFYTQQQPYLKPAIAAECAALLDGDIPLFTTHPNTRDVWSSAGQCLREFLREASLPMVYRRLQQLSHQDMTQQLWFIRASLATMHIELNHVAFPTYALTTPQTLADREQLLAAARAIGDRLEVLAVRGTHDAAWVGLTFVGERQWSLVSLGLDLYDGLSGITLFLAYLGAMTDIERYTTLARAALRTVHQRIERYQSEFKQIGAFGGRGGLIYLLTHLAVLWKQPELLTAAEQMVQSLPPLIAQDAHFDIIYGAAGCLASVLCLYRHRPAEATRAVARLCGERLIARAEPMTRGIGWRAENVHEKPLAGFSHGAAGIAWALLELAAVTGEEQFATTAIAAIEYERSLFLPEEGNWGDLRHGANTGRFGLCSWCHGAPGVGLARLRGLHHLDTAAIRAEIATALTTTLRNGFGRNHSLCHGDVGNLELLLQASLTLDDPQWHAHVSRLSATILESIQTHGYLCGVPAGLETPGLMTGLAGIGYGLLRLAVPDQVPAVLALEPPKLNH